MKVTEKWLVKKGACPGDIRWFLSQDETDVKKVALKLVEESKVNFANWLLINKMTRSQCNQYAVFAERQILKIFEKTYPEDKRPIKEIEVAEAYIKNPCAKTKDATADAACACAAANAYSDADDVMADIMADVLADIVAARAACAYAACAADAVADATAKRQMQLKIIKYGIKLLGLK